MKKSSSKERDDENGDENIEVINTTEENVTNTRNKTLAFSSFTISKYKKYTLNDITNKINLRNKDKKNSIKIKPKTKSCGNKILIIDSIESENIAQENILSKMNIYNDNNINNNIYLNEEKKYYHIKIFLNHNFFPKKYLLSKNNKLN